MTPDEKYMQQALKLAAKGGRAVAPNPMVGAVIVKNGRVVGKGYHKKFGGPHAEVSAIRSARRPSDLVGAMIYVTLEPCRHHGKTPPCWDLIQSVGIKKIVCGSADPFQKKKQGMIFLKGSVADQCKALNKFYFTWITKKRPFITAKVAISADGFVAGEGGRFVRITNRGQDVQVHKLRAQHQAIMVGSNTVLADDSHLGVRLTKGKDPLRIILDSLNRIPKTAKVFRDVNVMHVTKRISFQKLFAQLAKQGIASVLVESGPTLYTLLKENGLIDELIVFRGNKKLGKGLSFVV